MAQPTPQPMRPTIPDLTGSNHFAQLARNTWLTKQPTKALSSVLENDIWTALQKEDFSTFSLLLLEQLQCLERYLWPTFSSDTASDHHVILLALLVNTKRRERLPTWPVFKEKPEEFSGFFRRFAELSIDSSLSTSLRTKLLEFVVGAFQSLDEVLVRKECSPLVSIGIWQKLHNDAARDKILAGNTQVLKAWRAAGRRFDNADAESQARLRFERSWLYTLLLDFLDRLYAAEDDVETRKENLRYCERFLEFLCDILSQLPTRRYVRTLLLDLNILTAIRLSPLYDSGSEAALLREIYGLLEHYANFPIDDHSGRQLSRQEFEGAKNARISQLQNVAMRLQPAKLKVLVLSNYGSLSKREDLSSHLKSLTDGELFDLCQNLGLRTQYPDKSLLVLDRTFYLEILVSLVERKPHYTTHIQRDLPILPTEEALYAPSLLRTDDYNSTMDNPLPIPKLNLQYLSVGDFLHRSYTLSRNEAFFEIRKHVEDVIKRMQPRSQQQGGTSGGIRFDGFSRLAIPIGKPAIIETLPPRVGEAVPAEVKVEVVLDVSRLQQGVRREWEGLRQGDVVFLVAVAPPSENAAGGRKLLTNGNTPKHSSEAERAGLKTLRCAEVISVLDDQGRVLRPEHARDEERVRQRRLLLRLDTRAYKADKERVDAGKGDVYDSIHVIVRRKARENNFKAVLESIRQLLLSSSSEEELAVPTWLQEVFLGFGDPASASYKRLPNRLKKVDFRDTFLDWQHLIESLPGQIVEPNESAEGSFAPPYVLESTESKAAVQARPNKKRRHDEPDGPEPASTSQSAEVVKVSTYTPPNTGPYPASTPKKNTVRFTPAQVSAIASGVQPGLTLIVGPPGTGKTDVATQIISNLYHNHPEQRTLLVAHSNQALNLLFAKIVALDIDERHLLRLGHGEEELEGSWGKLGRVERFVERGRLLLGEVGRLARGIGVVGEHGASCETAEYFNGVHVRPLWKRFWDGVEGGGSKEVVKTFPFYAFFANAPQPLFPAGASREEVLAIARGCERHMQKMFEELAEIRPFEILKLQRDKANYLLVKEARIIAMTATHAAMRRQEIAQLGFRYENLVVEEAAQMTEIENFLPFVMQDPKGGIAGLQRIVLVGDHLQNSPVVQNAAFRSYANLEQSLFQRLIRLGVPHILLDAQGRSKPSLAALCRWRYPHLTNLPFTSTAPEFVRANAGLRYDFQFIEVPDYKGKGENEPSPHYLQNLGEAEYAVALYQYMRLLGYPAEKISILATYAGQRALIRDVLIHRCKGNRLFGMPAWVGTVDKYQGEQNDYIILSLVRTKAPGYLRDLRRLTVALSRARLGLYVFGRKAVFESSLELREVFVGFEERQGKLELVTGEVWPADRGLEDEVENVVEMEGVEHLGQYVYEMTEAKVRALREGGGMLPPVENGGRVDEEDEEDGEGLGEADDALAGGLDEM